MSSKTTFHSYDNREPTKAVESKCYQLCSTMFYLTDGFGAAVVCIMLAHHNARRTAPRDVNFSITIGPDFTFGGNLKNAVGGELAGDKFHLGLLDLDAEGMGIPPTFLVVVNSPSIQITALTHYFGVENPKIVFTGSYILCDDDTSTSFQRASALVRHRGRTLRIRLMIGHEFKKPVDFLVEYSYNSGDAFNGYDLDDVVRMVSVPETEFPWGLWDSSPEIEDASVDESDKESGCSKED